MVGKPKKSSVKGTDYLMLGPAYLSCAYALKNGAVYACTVNPIMHDEYGQNG